AARPAGGRGARLRAGRWADRVREPAQDPGRHGRGGEPGRRAGARRGAVRARPPAVRRAGGPGRPADRPRPHRGVPRGRHPRRRLGPGGGVYGGCAREGGYEARHELLDGGTEATCVVAVNDVMAVGAMAALRHRGVALPSEMAVAGFDDIATLRDVTPALTTVRLPLEELGTAAVEMVLAEPADQPRVRPVRGGAVLPESTPPPPAPRAQRPGVVPTSFVK